MTLDEAYEKLGLEHPLTFEKQNGVGGRQRGATTLMLVQAALRVIDRDPLLGDRVILVGRTAKHSHKLAADLISYVRRLSFNRVQIASRPMNKDLWQLTNDREIRWLSIDAVEQGAARGLRGLTFDDTVSEGRLDNYLYDLRGPFEQVTVIRAEWAYGEDEPRYNGYDRREQLILELTKEGAEQLAATQDVPIFQEYDPKTRSWTVRILKERNRGHTLHADPPPMVKWDYKGISSNSAFDPDGNVVDLNALTRRELADMAKGLGVPCSAKDGKQTIIDQLRQAP